MIFFLLIIYITLAQVYFDGKEIEIESIKDEPFKKEEKINFIQYNIDSLKEHKIFTESQSSKIILMNNCFDKDIQNYINSLLNIFNEYDKKNISKCLFYTKLSKDLQNNRNICDAIHEAIKSYSKRMIFIINQRLFRPDISVKLKSQLDALNIKDTCASLMKNILINKMELFKCLQNYERESLIHALREKTRYEETLLK